MSTDADLNRIATMPTPEAFHELAAREPRLRSLEDEARQGQLGALPDVGDLTQLAESMVQLPVGHKAVKEWKGSLPELADLWRSVSSVENNLDSRVGALVGPGGNAKDEILKSTVAYNIVISHLRSLLPQSPRPIPPAPG